MKAEDLTKGIITVATIVAVITTSLSMFGNLVNHVSPSPTYERTPGEKDALSLKVDALQRELMQLESNISTRRIVSGGNLSASNYELFNKRLSVIENAIIESPSVLWHYINFLQIWRI